MLPAGAPEGNRQITLSFMNIVRQEVDKQVGDALDELAALGKRSDITRNPRIAASQRSKLRHEVWVRKKAYVKNQVRILRHPVAEPEADTGDHQVFTGLLLLEPLRDVGTQFMHVELRSVDHQIGQRPDRSKVFAFRRQRGFYGRIGSQGM